MKRIGGDEDTARTYSRGGEVGKNLKRKIGDDKDWVFLVVRCS